MKKKIFLIIGIVILTGVILFRNIPFENGKIITLSDYVNQPATQITINIPKYSFNYKDVNYNVSANNFRSYRILKKDLEEILSSYRKISCDGKEYYYYNPDSLSDSYTIIDYGINNHYIYSTIYYKYSLGNYCEVKEIKDKVSYRTLYYQELAKENKKYTMTFLVGTTNDVYKAELNVYVYNETTKTTEVIEKSNGKFKLYDNKLIYKRNIQIKANDINMPDESVFMIENKNTLRLETNYLSNIFESITLNNEIK